ncbi:glycoside hydrolase [Euryarchaeota archaeon]|nr:glycoside hydrolase [Euryarchaeota archaeon]
MSEEETILEAELYESENVIGLAKPRAIGPFSSVQVAASALVVLLLASTILYNFMSSEEVLPVYQQESSVVDNTVFVTDSSGMAVDATPIDMTFFSSSVGEDAAEPSIGITSSGCIFFIAFEKVMRSCDYGETWEEKQDPALCAPTTSDPYGWVDPVTDRVFNVQMMGLESSWICWSDNDGETWAGNPHDSGTTPLNDHIKLATGPWTDSGYGLVGQFSQTVYDTAVYYCYNKLAGIFCFTSFDGGASFEAGGQIVGLATTNGGLHGAISTAPDGTVYVTPRVATPTVIVSKDNGFSWFERTMGEDQGTPNPRKNSEVSTDSESNAYHVWTGADEGIYLARSTDSGETWEQESLRVSPSQVISTAFPQTDAGDPGRFAVTYLGSENVSLLNESNLDGNPWDGNGHYAPNEVHYHLYVTFSLNALDEDPVFHTRRLTTDPVQVGAICLNSGDCRSDQGGSNRNLLDFNDLHIDREGRVFIAIADGCTGECATMESPTPADSRDKLGMMYMLDTGPSLYVANGELTSVKPESSDEEVELKMIPMVEIEATRQE